MLTYINERTLEGIMPASDCEKNLKLKWLSESSTCNFYIGDDNLNKRNIESFLSGKQKCKVDSQSYFKYLDDLSEILNKFKHIFYGPVSVVEECREHFANLPEEERYIFISYTYPDRYLKTSKLDKNVKEFKISLAANITNIKIEKSSTGEFTVYVTVIENWREEIMAKSSKCNLSALIEIFNGFVKEGERAGNDKQFLARLFGIKYANLLKNNAISIDDVINGSNYAADNLLEAAQDGMRLSPEVLWTSKFNNGVEAAEQYGNLAEAGEYIKFKRLTEWFVRQININNGIELGDKTSGCGYSGQAIRQRYKDWREYGKFTLDCNLRCDLPLSSKVNYINVTQSGMNIRPFFDRDTKAVTALYIELFDTNVRNSAFADKINGRFSYKYQVDALGLFDGKEPNEELKKLFDDFNKFYEEVKGFYAQSGNNSPLNIHLIDRAKRSDESKVNELNVIIYGPPGTGKTYSSAEYAVAAIENRAPRDILTGEQRKELMESYQALEKNGQIIFTTFHQNYCYEDFIQGLRPQSKDGVMEFVPKNGRFKALAETAIKDKDNNYVIIIDEINRGNISKIFGELITLIEDDKRWGEENQMSLTLPSGEEFAVPNNLYIIGTMNSADKSIALIDAALRRRFDFIEVAPNPDLISDPTLKNVLIKLNDELSRELSSSDLLIGHAYFINKTKEDLAHIMNRKIIPLLYEYFYDQSTKVTDILKKVLHGTDVEIDTGNNQGRIKVK